MLQKHGLFYSRFDVCTALKSVMKHHASFLAVWYPKKWESELRDPEYTNLHNIVDPKNPANLENVNLPFREPSLRKSR